MLIQMKKWILKRVKTKLNIQDKLKMNKKHYKREFCSIPCSPFPNCQNLKPTALFALYWKRIILLIFSFMSNILKNKVKIRMK